MWFASRCRSWTHDANHRGSGVAWGVASVVALAVFLMFLRVLSDGGDHYDNMAGDIMKAIPAMVFLLTFRKAIA